MLSTLSECFNGIQKVCLCFFVTINNGLSWILGEHLIFNDELMKIVPQKVCTCVSTMSIEHTEETTFWPIFNIFLGWRLHYIQHNTNPVFIIISNDALISICCISHYNTVLPNTAFCWFPAWQIKGSWVGWWSISKEEFLDIKWFIWRLYRTLIRLIVIIICVILDNI